MTYKFQAYCLDRYEWVNIIDLGMFGTGEIREVSYTYDDEPYERYQSKATGENIVLVDVNPRENTYEAPVNEGKIGRMCEICGACVDVTISKDINGIYYFFTCALCGDKYVEEELLKEEVE
ncbi:hypothetical protein [Salinicoccus albus]|uniref:hypothetical protein n=1 Tax=Salinicoccus albus TaxID=418756 RepID=UPI00035E0686|nr:hypothetical protein [Salinicoccus albus]